MIIYWWCECQSAPPQYFLLRSYSVPLFSVTLVRTLASLLPSPRGEGCPHRSVHKLETNQSIITKMVSKKFWSTFHNIPRFSEYSENYREVSTLWPSSGVHPPCPLVPAELWRTWGSWSQGTPGQVTASVSPLSSACREEYYFILATFWIVHLKLCSRLESSCSSSSLFLLPAQELNGIFLWTQ